MLTFKPYGTGLIATATITSKPVRAIAARSAAAIVTTLLAFTIGGAVLTYATYFGASVFRVREEAYGSTGVKGVSGPVVFGFLKSRPGPVVLDWTVKDLFVDPFVRKAVVPQSCHFPGIGEAPVVTAS